MAAEIRGSVGERGSNRADDVVVVQRLLMSKGFDTGGADGKCGQRTVHSIRTFQTGFLRRSDGRVDPGGETWRRLNGAALVVPPVAPPPPADGALSRTLPRPDRTAMNVGLVAVSNRYMTEKLGSPRQSYSQDCQPMTNEKLKRHIVSRDVGPFKVTGLRPAVDSLQAVLDDIRTAHRDVYTALGTAGMLCCRNQRNSKTAISNHSWGTAIDLKINNLLDFRGDGSVQYGLALIAPIFNRHGWYWGAAFRTEDAMHFEASKALIDAWAPGLTA